MKAIERGPLAGAAVTTSAKSVGETNDQAGT
jgi:hypothetical protein